VFNGTIHWSEFFWPFALPTLAGNIIGGTFIFALLSHAQIRNDMAAQKKEQATAQAKSEKVIAQKEEEARRAAR